MFWNFYLISKEFLYSDHAVLSQIGFQYPASPLMIGIIDLHNHICFFLVFIFYIVCYFLILTLFTSTISIQRERGKLNSSFFSVKKLYNIDIKHNTLLELIWICIPTIILLIIVLHSFSLLYSSEINMESNMTLKVIGHQWYWSYELYLEPNYNFNNYAVSENLRLPQQGHTIMFDSYAVPESDLLNTDLRWLTTTNPVCLPYQTNVKVLITSDDVLHSWAIPALGIKMDACPGRLNQVNLYTNRIGHFYGQCSELCGVNHGFMPIEIFSVSKNDFLSWVYLVSEDITNLVETPQQKFFFFLPFEASLKVSSDIYMMNINYINTKNLFNDILISSLLETSNKNNYLINSFDFLSNIFKEK